MKRENDKRFPGKKCKFFKASFRFTTDGGLSKYLNSTQMPRKIDENLNSWDLAQKKDNISQFSYDLTNSHRARSSRNEAKLSKDIET